MKKKQPLPNVVYVYQEENRYNSIDLLVTHDLSERGEGRTGIYMLMEVVETRYLPQVKRVGKAWEPIKESK